jgi:hypothetical protein
MRDDSCRQSVVLLAKIGGARRKNLDVKAMEERLADLTGPKTLKNPVSFFPLCPGSVAPASNSQIWRRWLVHAIPSINILFARYFRQFLVGGN